jgi:nucleoside-diphosphate-sugar epimerase
MRSGIRKIVTASSITAMGYPFDEPPASLPIDESTTAAYNTYALAKVAEEAMWAQLVHWEQDMSITSLRFTNVVAPGEYGTFAMAADPLNRRDLLFSYVDSRDGAAAVALALVQAAPGFEVYDIAASDTGSALPTAELVALHFPGVPVRAGLGEYETLMSIDKARRRLGYEPVHLWRDEYAAHQGRQRTHV